MRKVFAIGRLESESLKDSKLNQALIVAYRKDGVVYYQNLEMHPATRGRLTYNQQTNELSFVFKLENGDFIVLGDDKGIADKGIAQPAK